MDRRNFITDLAMAGSGLLLSRRGGASASRPNLLLIIVDQMRKPVWFRGNRLLNFEGLQAESLEFINHFASSVPCSPSRAGLWTGKYPHEHKVWENETLLDPAIPTLGNYFQGLGYRTVYFGKWHLGDESKRKDFEFKTPDAIQGIAEEEDRKIVAAFQSWLSGNHSRGPWLAVVSLLNPHEISRHYFDLARPPENRIKQLPDNWKDVDDRWTLRIGKTRVEFDTKDPKLSLGYLNWYYYFHTLADARLGEIIGALKQSGIYDSTLILFTSDHGEMAVSHGLTGKPPLPFSEVLNIPLLIKIPGRRTHTVIKSAGDNTGVWPTLAGLLGESPPKLSGLNLLDASRRGPCANFEAWVMNNQICRGKRDDQWAWMQYPTGKELYHLAKDPLMLRNLG